MIDIHTATNGQLDEITAVHDAREGERAMAAVHAFLGRFVAYPSKHAHVAHALWILHAHLMDQWELTPRIAFLSAEPACGKTRALEITELLVPNPVAAVNVSPAYLFRKVGGDREGDNPVRRDRHGVRAEGERERGNPGAAQCRASSWCCCWPLRGARQGNRH